MKKNSKLRAVLFGVVFLLIFLGIQIVMGAVGGMVGSTIAAIIYGADADIQELTTAMIPAITLAAEIASIIVFGIWYNKSYVKKDKEEGTYESGFKKIANIKDIVFIISLTMVAHCACVLLSKLVQVLIPGSAELFDTIMSLAVGENDPIGLITVMLAAPIAEELGFRGVLLKRSRQTFGIVGCIILNAILFGIMHLNPLQSIYVLPMAVSFTYIAIKYNSVVPAILSHIINNSVGMMLPMILKRNTSNIENVVIMVVFLALMIFVCYKKPEKTAAETV